MRALRALALAAATFVAAETPGSCDENYAGGAGLGLVVVEREYARDEVLIQELAARV